jgi:hypothetical protein
MDMRRMLQCFGFLADFADDPILRGFAAFFSVFRHGPEKETGKQTQAARETL